MASSTDNTLLPQKFLVSPGFFIGLNGSRDSVFFERAYEASTAGDDGKQYFSISMNAFGRLVVLLPDVADSVKSAISAAINYNHVDKEMSGEIGNLCKTWPLSSVSSVFLSFREGKNQYEGKRYVHISIRGSYERGGQFYPKKGDGVTVSVDIMDELTRAVYDCYTFIKAEGGTHHHVVQPLCAMCKMVAGGSVKCDQLALKKQDLEAGGKEYIINHLQDSLSKYMKSGYTGTWHIAIGAKGWNVGGLPPKSDDQTTTQQAFEKAAAKASLKAGPGTPDVGVEKQPQVVPAAPKKRRKPFVLPDYDDDSSSGEEFAANLSGCEDEMPLGATAAYGGYMHKKKKARMGCSAVRENIGKASPPSEKKPKLRQMIMWSGGKLQGAPPSNLVGGWQRVLVPEEDAARGWIDPKKYHKMVTERKNTEIRKQQQSALASGGPRMGTLGGRKNGHIDSPIFLGDDLSDEDSDMCVEDSEISLHPFTLFKEEAKNNTDEKQ